MAIYCIAGGGSKGKKKLAGPLFHIYWWRIVLDESQAIKNANTLVAHAAHCLQVHVPAVNLP